MHHTACTDDPKRCIVTFCPSLSIITSHQVCIVFMDFSYTTRSKSWQSDHQIGFLQIYTKSPIVVVMIVKRSLSTVYLFSSVDKRQLLSRDLISPLSTSNMINFESWQHTIRCRYSCGSAFLNFSLLDQSLTLLLSALHYSMISLFT